MRVFACGNCGGALEVEDKVPTIQCVYCGYTNETADLESELAAFKEEMTGWLAGLGVAGGSGMDSTMRQIYFKDQIYPALCTEFSNLVGDAEDILDFPLAYLSIYQKIPDLAIRTDWSTDQGKPMKELARKLESSNLTGFVLDSESKYLLAELRLRALVTPMMMDIVDFADTPSTKNLRRSSEILNYLADQTQILASMPANDEPSKQRKVYHQFLAKRFTMSADAFDWMAKTVESRKAEEGWSDEYTQSIRSMQIALRELKYISVIDRVLLDTGLQNDASALSAGHDLSMLYSENAKIPFEAFIQAVKILSEQTALYYKAASNIDLSWFQIGMNAEKFSWFLSTLHKTVTGKSFQIMADKVQVETWASKVKNAKGFFLYPFFLLKVKSILKSGFLLWKKGNEETFYSLCDGAFNLFEGFYTGDFPSLMTPGFKKMVGSKQEKLILSLAETHPRPLPPKWVPLPPCVTPNDTAQLYTAAHNLLEEVEFAKQEGIQAKIPASYKKKGFDPGKVKALAPEVIRVVYLPMVVTQKEVKLLGKHLGIEEKLTHRKQFAHSITQFLNAIKAFE